MNEFVANTPELTKLSNFFTSTFQPNSISFERINNHSLWVIDRRGGKLKASYGNDQIILNDGVGPQPWVQELDDGSLQQTDWVGEPTIEP